MQVEGGVTKNGKTSSFNGLIGETFISFMNRIHEQNEKNK
jgi:hypothetical protein